MQYRNARLCWMRVCWIVLAGLIGAGSANADSILRFVDPVDTDPLMTPLTDFPNAQDRDLRHFVALDPSLAVGNRLHVWLPGTTGLPDDYETYAATSAALGYHTLSIAYPNIPAVHELLMNDPDPLLAGQIRGERWFGDDLTDAIEVNRTDSIENRIVKLLEYNIANHPDEGWDAFLNVDSTVRWDRVVVGGHSQGAGHSAFLTKSQELAGVVMYAGPGDNIPGQGEAPWLAEPSMTPNGRLFAFNHMQDIVVPAVFGRLQTLGLNAFGPVQNVDGLTQEQLTSHNLTSTHIEPGVFNYHSATIADHELFFDNSGRPFYEDVWQYMLEELLPLGDF